MRPGAAQIGASAGRVRSAGGGGGNNLALYPSYSRSRIMWPTGDFNEPALPVNPTTPVLATNATIFNSALAGSNKTITVPNGIALGGVGGNVGSDIEIVIAAGGSIQKLSTNGGNRVRIRGPGKLGGISPSGGNDWIVDGVPFAPDSLGVVTTCLELFQMTRMAIINCVAHACAGGHPTMYWSEINDVLVANSNFSVHDGNLNDGNCWVLRVAPSAPCNRLLFVDTVMQTFTQALRLDRDQGGQVNKFQMDHAKMVNTFTPGDCLNAEQHVGTNYCYLRDCTTVMGDDSSPGVDNLWGWCANTGKTIQGAQDLLWHVVDHTYVRRAANCVDDTQLANRESTAQGLGWSVYYRGTAADYTRIDGRVFVTDPAITSKWMPDGTSTAWPTIHSPLTGVDTGANPFVL